MGLPKAADMDIMPRLRVSCHHSGGARTMLKLLVLAFSTSLVLSLSSVLAADKADENSKKTPPALDFTMKTLDGKEADLKQYLGKVVLVVNVASKCGLTPQYEQLQALHEKFGEKGLAVVGFPCNQFGAQEPGTPDEIRQFCTANYKVTFDLFAKIDVNGDGACPLYKYLTSLDTKPAEKGKIAWNFEKFVINRKGEVVARFSPRTKPDDPEVLKVIEAELAAK
jgi:glutathione peroxidase